MLVRDGWPAVVRRLAGWPSLAWPGLAWPTGFRLVSAAVHLLFISTGLPRVLPFLKGFMQDILHAVLPPPPSCKTNESCMGAMMGPPPGTQEQGGVNTKMPDWGLKFLVLGHRVFWFSKFSTVPGRGGALFINAIIQLNNVVNWPKMPVNNDSMDDNIN